MKSPAVRFLIAVMIAMALLFSVHAAFAQAQTRRFCMPESAMAKFLTGTHKEQRIGLGIGGSGKAIWQFYLSESGSWTVTMTMTNKMACVMGGGHSWQSESLTSHLPKT